MARQRTPSAVDAFMQSYSKRYAQNENEASKIAETLRQDGYDVTDEVMTNIRQQLAMKGTVAVAPANADQEGEEAGAQAPAVSAGDPTMPQMSAITSEEWYDRNDRSVQDFFGDMGAGFRAGAREGLAALLEAPAGLYNASASTPLSGIGALAKLGIIPERMESADFIKDEAARLRRDAGDIRTIEFSDAARAGEDVLADAEGFTGTLGTLARNPGVAADILATQVGQMMSTLAGGGPQGMLALSALQAGSMSARDVREMAEKKGWTPEQVQQAEDLAFTVSAGANYVVPRAMQRQGGMAIEELLTGAARTTAATTTARAAAKPLVGEGVSEMATEAIEQLGQNVALDEPWSQGLDKAAALGLALGSTMGSVASPTSVSRNNAEWQRLETNARLQADRQSLEDLTASVSPATPAAQPTTQATSPSQGSLFPELEPGPTSEVVDQNPAVPVSETTRMDDAEWLRGDRTILEGRIAEEDARIAELNQREKDAPLLKEYGYDVFTEREAADRDAAMARREQLIAERNSTLGGAVGQTALPLDGAGQVQPQRSATQTRGGDKVIHADDSITSNVRDAATLEANTLLESQRKSDTKNAQDTLAAYKKEHAANREKEKQRLAEQSRTITDPNARTTAVVDGIVAWDAANPTPTAVPEGWTPPKRREGKRGKGRQGNSQAPVQQATAPAQVTTPAAATTGPNDARIKQLADKMGLEMRSGTTRTPKQSSDAQSIISDLVKKRTTDAANVLEVMGQGKLSVVPNSSSIGVDGNEDSAAMYVPADGKMYLFSDKVRKGDAVGSIIKAFHEATHAGQFNSREGRSSVMQQIMGRDKATSAENKIRDAAKKGNKLAKRAVAKAEKAAPEGTDLNSLEVMPYFVGEVMASRATTFGSLGSVVRDMKAGARNMVRTATGMDLDVNLDDIYAATRGVVAEIAQTDLKPTEGDYLNMLLGEQATNFEANKLAGRTYTNETGHEQFLISDADSELKPDAVERLLRRSDFDPIPMGELLDHNALYTEMPEARNISVFLDSDTNAWGYYTFGMDAIGVNPGVVNGEMAAGLRETLLHEVQHWVQDKQGRVGEIHNKKPPAEEKQWLDDHEAAQKELADLSEEFVDAHSGQISKYIPRARRKEVMKAVMDREVSSTIKAHWLANNIDTEASLPEALDDARAKLIAAQERLRDAQYYAKVAHNNARKRYIKNITEKEAFYTQANINTRAADLPINPETDPRFGTEAYAKGDKKRTGLAMKDTAFTEEDVKALPAHMPYFREGDPPGTEYSLVEARTKAGNRVLIRDYLIGDRTEIADRSVDANAHHMDAYVNGEAVASLSYSDNASVVSPDVVVDDEFQREGIATLMYKRAADLGGDLGGATKSNAVRTDDGRAFRRAMDTSEVSYSEVYPSRRGLAMAGETSEPTKRYAPSVLTGMFRADRGLSPVHNEIIEFAITSPAGRRMEAEAAMGRYDTALREQASDSGKSVDELSKEIADVLEGIEFTDSWDGNIAALAEAMRPYGAAGDAIMDLRNIADELSLLMMEQRAADPKPLTANEKAVYAKVRSNLGKYTHRMYAAHTGDLGSAYSKAVWGDYNKVKKLRSEDGEGTDVQEANYTLVRDALDTIIEDGLLIPEDSKLYQTGSDKIDRLYSVWGSSGRTEGMSVDEKRDALADIRDRVNGDTDSLNKMAEKLAQDLLSLTASNSPVSAYYRGGRQNNSILKSRSDIPKSLRALMGEITEPGLKFVSTIAKQSQYLASNKMLLELADNMGGDILPPGSVTPDNWTVLTGETFGPLEGYHASPNMLMALGDVQQQIATFEQMVGMAGRDPKSLANRLASEVAKKYGNLAATSKMLQIIYNPANLAFNFAGGFGTMLTNGNLNPATLASAMVDAKDLVVYASNPTAVTDSIRDLVQYDIVDSAFVGEIKNDQYRALAEEVRKMSGRGRSETAASIISKLHGAKAGWKETYAMMDVVFKIANFKAEVAHLEAYYDALGETRTEEQLKREAADVTKRTNFTFRRVAPILKALEAGGITAFGPYMHEVFRTQIASTMQGIKEIRDANAIQDSNPEAASIKRWRGARRLIGQVAYLVMTAAAARALASIEFGDDPEEEKQLRALLGDRFGDQDYIRVGVDEAGYPVLMSWSRTDAYGPLTDIMRAVINTKSDPKEVAEKAFGVYIMPRMVPQIIKFAKTAADRGEKVSRTPLLQQMFPTAYSEVIMDGARAAGLDARIAKAGTNLIEATYFPGVTTSWRDTNARPAGDGTADVAFRAMSYGGFNFQSLNPAKPVRFGTMDYANAIKYGRRDLKDFMLENPDRTENELTNEILRQRRVEREAYDDLRDVYLGALAAGMSKREAMGYMKSAQLTNEGISSVVNGRFKSQVVSEDSIKSSMEQELRAAPRSEHAEIRAKWNNIRTLLLSAARNTN